MAAGSSVLGNPCSPLWSHAYMHSLFSVKNHKVLLDSIQAVLQVFILLWTERPSGDLSWTLWAIPKHSSSHPFLSSGKETPGFQGAPLFRSPPPISESRLTKDQLWGQGHDMGKTASSTLPFSVNLYMAPGRECGRDAEGTLLPQ